MKRAKFLISAIIIFMIFFLIPGIANAQSTGYAGVQSPFILGVGARALALGNAYVAVPVDATTLYWNPAGIDHIQWKNLSIFYTNLPAASQYYFLGYVHPTISFGTFGVGAISIGTGDIHETAENNVPLGTNSYSHQQFLLSYGKQLPWNFSVGLNLKMERQYSMGYSVTGLGADLGFMYTPNFNNILLSGLSLGLTIQNLIGPRLKLGVATDVIPRVIRFGLAKPILKNEWGKQFAIFLDFEQGERVPFKYHAGTEYVFQNMAMLRVGMNNNQLSFGAGAVFNMFQLDYSFGKFSENDFSPNHRISFTVKIGKSKDELIRIAEEKRFQEAKQIADQQVVFERNKKISESMERGKTYLSNGDYARALREFNFVINYEKEMPTAAEIKEAKKLYEIARTENDKKTEERIKEIQAKNAEEKKRERDKLQLNNYFKQGMAYFEGEDYEKAIEEWNKMLEIDPDNELAKQYIATAKTEHEQKILSLITRADKYGRSRKFLEAISELNKARRLGPNDKQIKLIEQRINDYEKQMNFIELFQQGYTYYIQKNYQNAMISFKNALSLQPDDATVRKYYADAEARANMRKVPMTEGVRKRYYEGLKLFTAAKYEQALKIWEEIQKIQPYSEDILKGIDLVRERIEQQKKRSR